MNGAINLTNNIIKMGSPNGVTHAFGVQTSDGEIYKVYGYDTSKVPMVAVINRLGRNTNWDTQFKKFGGR